jgi:hypothetical protein
MVFKILQPLNLIDNNLFFTSFPNIHVADFCSFINNKFEKNGGKNPVAQKYVCA